jgi:hypothetical protein
MSLFKTYLNDQFIDYFFKEDLKGCTVRPGAIVEAPNLERVFDYTNSIEDVWTKNKEIVKLLTDSKRSLSVGDLVEDLTTGAFHVVQSFGYRELSKEELEQITFIRAFTKVTPLRTILHRKVSCCMDTECYVDKVETDLHPIMVIWRYLPGLAGGVEIPAESSEVEVITAIDLKTCLPFEDLKANDSVLFALEQFLYPIGEERYYKIIADGI